MLVKIYWFIELWYLYFLSIFFLYFFVESFVKIVQVFTELVPFLAAINKMIYPAWTQLFVFHTVLPCNFLIFELLSQCIVHKVYCFKHIQKNCILFF